MPHVKGNKFKPAKQATKEIAAGASPEEDAQRPPIPARTKSSKPSRKRRRVDKPASSAVPTVVTLPAKGNAASAHVPSSNWLALKQALQKRNPAVPPSSHKAKHDKPHARTPPTSEDAGPAATPRTQRQTAGSAQATKILAIDCEMVGAGKSGDKNVLARVSIVNAVGLVVLDTFVAPSEPITDYRTKWSGVRPFNLRGAPSLEEITRRVASLVAGRLLVGHSIQNDLDALGLRHPPDRTRDTARYPPLMRVLPGGRQKPRSLKELAREHLGLEIQGGEHCSIEDARAALSLYQKHRKEWERWVASGASSGGVSSPAAATIVPSSMAGKGLEGLMMESKPQNGRKRKHGGVNPRSVPVLDMQRLAELAKNDYMADL
jgi:RNA exonuclease 4